MSYLECDFQKKKILYVYIKTDGTSIKGYKYNGNFNIFLVFVYSNEKVAFFFLLLLIGYYKFWVNSAKIGIQIGRD